MDDDGEGLKEHLVGKYGPRAASMVDDPNNHLMRSGRAVGIAFNNNRKIYPTLKAHALMEYLKEQGQNDQANQLMEAMYAAYFEKGQNINDDSVLADLAQSTAGLSRDASLEILQNGLRLQDIQAKDRVAKTRMGVTGVPYFILEASSHDNNKQQQRPVAFSGAQPVDLIAEVLQEVADGA